MDCCAGAKAKKVGVIIEMYGLGTGAKIDCVMT